MAAMVIRNKNAKATARGFEATNWVDFVRENERVLKRIRDLPTQQSSTTDLQSDR